MTIQIKHSFVSAKGDGGDATLVRPSNWNAVHTTSMATGQLLGRLTAGVGAFEEIPISAYMAGLLAAADQATLAGLLGLFETGDVKYSFKNSASSGWLLLTGGTAGNINTIGNAASGATLRANADTQALYVLIYTNCADGLAPVSGGRSGNAVTDFNANKTLQIPQLVGRSPMGAGAVTTTTTSRNLGQLYGEENHALTVAELAVHYHVAGISDPTHTHNYNYTQNGGNQGGGGAFGFNITTASTTASGTGVRVNSSNGIDTTYSSGSGTAHNTVHPVTGLYAMVKL